MFRSRVVSLAAGLGVLVLTLLVGLRWATAER